MVSAADHVLREPPTDLRRRSPHRNFPSVLGTGLPSPADLTGPVLSRRQGEHLAAGAFCCVRRHNLMTAARNARLPQGDRCIEEIFMVINMLCRAEADTMSTRKPPTIPQPQARACCAPIGAEPLPAGDAAQLSRQFAALADPVRLRILSVLATAPGGAICACDLVEPVGKSQPTVSHHLKGAQGGRTGHRPARRQEHLVRGRACRPGCPARGLVRACPVTARRWR